VLQISGLTLPRRSSSSLKARRRPQFLVRFFSKAQSMASDPQPKRGQGSRLWGDLRASDPRVEYAQSPLTDLSTLVQSQRTLQQIDQMALGAGAAHSFGILQVVRHLIDGEPAGGKAPGSGLQKRARPDEAPKTWADPPMSASRSSIYCATA
jgi:hypothetical protein